MGTVEMVVVTATTEIEVVDMVAAIVITMTIVDHTVEMVVVTAATEIEAVEMVPAIDMTMKIVDHSVSVSDQTVVIAAPRVNKFNIPNSTYKLITQTTLVRTKENLVFVEYPRVLSLGYVHQIFEKQGEFKSSAGKAVVFARV